MTLEKLVLRTLRAEDEEAFRFAVLEFKEEEPDEVFAFHYDESISFSEYVKWLDLWTQGKELPERFVPNTFLVGVVGKIIVGRVSIRHEFNDFLERIGGHIGYAVVPSYRGRGYATEMLNQALSISTSLGISRALLTCDIDNIASQRVIEKNGGIFERLTDALELEIVKKRYWINLQ